jgi:translation initiation factor 2 alpha subunit (eIF-2alpha)
MENLEPGDLVIGIVDRIVGTVVFVKLDEKTEGSIVLSEIAPGRIRNLREYVVPNKKIVCKVLRISDSGTIELSLRRVSQKEKKEIFEKEELKKSYYNIIKSILKENSEKVIKEIETKEGIIEFFEEIKKEKEKGKEYFSEEELNRILQIINSYKKKKRLIKKEISLLSYKPEGVLLIKKILNSNEIKIRYIAAGRYSLEIESEDPKEAEKKIKNYLIDLEKNAKKGGLEFSIKQNN